MKTTLNQIRENKPCTEGWEKLLKHLGKTKADDEPLSIIQILDSNGLDDAVWCLQTVKGCDKEIGLFVVWCARQVQHLMTDQRSIDALDVAERFVNGDATNEELVVARDAAWTARDAAWVESAAAYAVYVLGGAWDAVNFVSWSAACGVDAATAAQEKRLRELCAECV